MNLQNAPEIADGGYWYVLNVVSDPELGGSTPGVVLGQGWCAWYTGDKVVVRTPEPITGIQTVEGVTAAELLNTAGLTSRPYGRIGGR